MDFWTYYWGFVSFVFGAIVGSFLNVCIWRLPRYESLVHPPSHCPACNHRLVFLPDMVPLLSQLWYRSRCRYCATPFSWRYFWVELFTALAFTAVYARYFVVSVPEVGLEARTWSTLAGMIFVAALIAIFFIDLEHYQIANSTVIVAIAAALVKDGVLIWKGARPLWQEIPGTSLTLPLPLSVLGGLLAFWFLWQFAALATAFLGKEAMGAGDAYLLGALGAFLIPWPLVLLAFLCSVALGTAGGLFNLWVYNRSAAAAGAGSGDREAGTTPQPDEALLAAAPVEEAPASSDNLHAPRDADSSTLPDANGACGVDAAEPPAPVSMPRGAAGVPGDAGEEREMPQCPPESRWGRVWTVLGTWLVLGALWGGAALFEENRALGVAVAVGGLALAVGVLVYGIRLWLAGDGGAQEGGWQEAMDEFFEEDPGPRAIPFGPYLVAGTLVAMFFGRQIIAWYVTSSWGLSMPLQDLARLPWD